MDCVTFVLWCFYTALGGNLSKGIHVYEAMGAVVLTADEYEYYYPKNPEPLTDMSRVFRTVQS